jgi:hypothetical protein
MFELFHVTGNRGQTEVFSQIDHRTLEKAHDTKDALNTMRMDGIDLDRLAARAFELFELSED